MAAEIIGVPFAGDGKAAHGNAVDTLDAGRPLVPPGDVIPGTGGDDLDFRVPRQPLGDVSRVQLGAAIDVRAIALDGDRQLHPPSPPPSLIGFGATGSRSPPPSPDGLFSACCSAL